MDTCTCTLLGAAELKLLVVHLMACTHQTYSIFKEYLEPKHFIVDNPQTPPPPPTHTHTSFCCGPGPGYTVSVFTHNVCFPFEVEPGYCITHGCHTVQMQVCMYNTYTQWVCSIRTPTLNWHGCLCAPHSDSLDASAYTH